MLTQQDIEVIYDGGESEVTVIDNPATPENDATIKVIADRMEQFKRSKHMNPNKVSMDDFDVASAFSDDPKNPIDGPFYFYIFRHKVTKAAAVVQNSAKYGWMIPFNVVFDLSKLAE